MKPLLHVPRSSDIYSRRCLLRMVVCFLLLVGVIFAQTAAAQQTAADSLTGSAVCTFDDGKQLSARYKPVAVSLSETPTGKVWAPGGSAMALFTETGVKLGNTLIPAGAYTMYLLPGKKDWTLIVSRNVTIDGKYDQNHDLVRVNMQTGELSRPEEQLKVFFGHTGPMRCEINVDYGKNRAWIDFMHE